MISNAAVPVSPMTESQRCLFLKCVKRRHLLLLASKSFINTIFFLFFNESTSHTLVEESLPFQQVPFPSRRSQVISPRNTPSIFDTIIRNCLAAPTTYHQSAGAPLFKQLCAGTYSCNSDGAGYDTALRVEARPIPIAGPQD